MQSQPLDTQVTFYYLNGETETFSIDDAAEAELLQQEFRRSLDKPWWILQLPEQTVCINTANILKIELKPAIVHLQAEGVFMNAQRITALKRSHRL